MGSAHVVYRSEEASSRRDGVRRWVYFEEGKQPLQSMSYFVLTPLEDAAGGASAALRLPPSLDQRPKPRQLPERLIERMMPEPGPVPVPDSWYG